MLSQHSDSVIIVPSGPGLTDITKSVETFVSSAKIADGLLTLFLRHTSASLLIQENADRAVLHDLENFFSRLVSRDVNLYLHQTEGPDDMPAHIRTALTQSSLSIPVKGGVPALGIWQSIYLFEHRDAPHQREIMMHVTGE
jgi:secondary thiamine-phosphate synthase enzyme